MQKPLSRHKSPLVLLLKLQFLGAEGFHAALAAVAPQINLRRGKIRGQAYRRGSGLVMDKLRPQQHLFQPPPFISPCDGRNSRCTMLAVQTYAFAVTVHGRSFG